MLAATTEPRPGKYPPHHYLLSKGKTFCDTWNEPHFRRIDGGESFIFLVLSCDVSWPGDRKRLSWYLCLFHLHASRLWHVTRTELGGDSGSSHQSVRRSPHSDLKVDMPSKSLCKDAAGYKGTLSNIPCLLEIKSKQGVLLCRRLLPCKQP